MSETLESLQRRKESAAKLGGVVRTMKALASSNMVQYNTAAHAIQEYYTTIALGLYACVNAHRSEGRGAVVSKKYPVVTVLIIGSGQGLVGRFNDVLAEFAISNKPVKPVKLRLWVAGGQADAAMLAHDLHAAQVFDVPDSIENIAVQVNHVLDEIGSVTDGIILPPLYVLYNLPLETKGYGPVMTKLLPLDNEWKENLSVTSWPTRMQPQVIGGSVQMLPALAREYLFVSLYRAFAASLSAENASRLEAMQRAEENIDDIQDELNRTYNQLRQAKIDEELFDVIAGFEALGK